MKDIKTFFKLVLLSVVSLTISCEKPPIPPDSSVIVMPPLTHQGIGTCGCYINGELFVANKGWTVWDFPPLSGSFNEFDGDLRLQASRYINEETGESDNIRIRADITEGEGVYDYRYNEEDGSLCYRNWYGELCDYYYLPDMDDHGKLTITHLDEEKNIISGTFYINLSYKSYHCEDGDSLMKITDGRFDFRY